MGVVKKKVFYKKFSTIIALIAVIAVFFALSYLLEGNDKQSKERQDILSLANELDGSDNEAVNESSIEEYLKQNQSDKEVAGKLANYYFKQKRYDDFLFIYKENNLQSASFINMVAAAYQAKGDISQAKQSYEEAISKYPKNIQSYISLSALNQSLGDLSESLAIIEKGLRNLPNSSQLLVTAASIAMKMGDNSLSADYAKRALKVDKNNKQANSILVAVGG